jgi:hypothetical protein
MVLDEGRLCLSTVSAANNDNLFPPVSGITPCTGYPSAPEEEKSVSNDGSGCLFISMVALHSLWIMIS